MTPILIVLIAVITDEVGQDWLKSTPHKIDAGNKRYSCDLPYYPPNITEPTLTIEDKNEVRSHLPNMGVYKCFLSSGHLGEGKSYFTQPIFLYFQLYLMIIQAANMFFLVSTLVTVRRLFRNQDKMKGGEKSLKSYKKQFSTIGRLCIVMGE